MSAVTKLDAERLARISERLEPHDAAWLRDQLLDRRQQAAQRRADRNSLIAAALDRLSPLPPTVAAKRLARILEDRARAFDAPPPPPGSIVNLADEILKLNGYATLRWRAIHGICEAEKSRCSREAVSLQRR